MSNNIKVNDLVMMVRGCPECKCKALGVPFIVTEIVGEENIRCGRGIGKGTYHNVGIFRSARGLGVNRVTGNYIQIPLPWLKKLDPGEEPEILEDEFDKELEEYNTSVEELVKQLALEEKAKA